MVNPFAAGIRYFAIVFAIAFALGTVRTLVVAPRTGEVIAVLIEGPFVLSVSWLVCRQVAAGVSPRPVARLAMGATAFGLLIAAELAMSVWLFGRPPAVWLAGLATVAGGLGIAGQIGFGVMPLFVRR